MIGYLLGCLNLAYVISKIKKVDIQQTGSKNLGASNATMNFGKRIGLLVMLHDILKTVLAIYIVRLIFPANPTLAYIAGTASVIGHMFPFWLHFKAGKGFACYLGMILSTTKISYFLILLTVCIILTLITDYIVSITFTTIFVSPIYTYISTQNYIYALIFAVATVFIFIKHIENIQRIRNHTEGHVRQTLFKKRK